MAITRQTYVVWYEDGTSQTVVGDQRDLVAFERAAQVGIAKAQDTMTVIALRHTAFYALRRNGMLPAPPPTVAQWDKTVIEVEAVEDEAEDADPTTAEASPTGPSDSPSTPA